MGFNVNSSVSALQAFTHQMQASANNVANVQSDEFKSSRVINSEGQNNQVGIVIAKDESPGPLVEDPTKTDGSLKELSNTDIATELVTQISAQRGFEANTKTIQTYDETLGTLIDIMG